MSRILNRPMFRGGGKVSSYGTGITTGLTKGYASGGQIGGGYIHGAAFPDGRYGFASPSTYAKNYNLIDWGKSTTKTGADVAKNAANKIKSSTGNWLKRGSNFLKKPVISERGAKVLAQRYGPKILNYGKGIVGNLATRFPKVGIAAPIYGAVLANKAIADITRPAEQSLSLQLEKSKAFDPTSPNFGGQFMNVAVGEQLADMERERLGLNSPDTPTNIDGPPGGGDKNMYAEKQVDPEGVPLTMKQQVEKDKALFADLLGEGEARGKDVSDMLLRFAGSGGDTVGEKFQQYIGNEAQAGPSRTEKINQAAASLAINDYIAGKRSKENMEMMIEKTKFGVDYTIKAQEARDDIKSMNFSDGLISYAKNVMGGRKNPMSDIVIKGVLGIQMPGKQINTKQLSKKNKGEIKTEDLDIGLNIVTYKGGKGIFEKISDTEVKELTELFIT